MFLTQDDGTHLIEYSLLLFRVQAKECCGYAVCENELLQGPCSYRCYFFQKRNPASGHIVNYVLPKGPSLKGFSISEMPTRVSHLLNVRCLTLGHGDIQV